MKEKKSSKKYSKNLGNTPKMRNFAKKLVKNKIVFRRGLNAMAYDLQSFLSYKQRLETCDTENSTEVIYNDSIVHAAMVYNQLFQRATRSENKTVNMFCGSLSILRDSTEKKIAEERERIRPKEGTSDWAEWENFQPFYDVKNAVKDFFEKGGKLNVVLENRGKSIEWEQMYPLLKDAYDKGKLYIGGLPIEIGLDHFTIVDNAYRCENSDERKTAICCFNDKQVTDVLMKSFELLKRMAVPFAFEKTC